MPPSPLELSLVDARRLALHAQGFGTARPATPDRGHIRRLLSRLGSLQIDAVNVLERAQYLPVYSRLGPYERSLLDDVVYDRGQGFEFMTHAASIVDSAQHPLWRWRMDAHAAEGWWIRGQAAIEARTPGYVQRVLDEVRDRGPLSFKDLSDPARRDRPPSRYSNASLLWASKRPSDGKHVLEAMWRAGVLAVRARTASFERVFDLTERCLPAAVLDAPTPTIEDAHLELVRHAMAALGVAWVKDVADYHRLKVAPTRAALRDLADAGEVAPVSVEGLGGEAYAVAPRRRSAPLGAAALLGPFDSLLWERSRNQRLFGFTHSFEIYVPEAKRRFGYYVLPFLLGEQLVARVDLKADRARATLLVQSAHLEVGMAAATVAEPLAAELRSLATWLGLEAVEVRPVGNLATALRQIRA